MERDESSLKRKRSKRKRKSQTTRIYRKMEQEVQLLLSHSNSNSKSHIGEQLAVDLELRSLEFFHGSGISELNSIQTDHNKSADEDSIATGGGTRQAVSLAATFIAIDLSDSPVVSAWLYRQRHFYDNSQLYVPNSVWLHVPLQIRDCEPQLSRAQIRMLNRYQEEAKGSGKCKLTPRFVALLTENASATGRFTIDATLYRSNCGKRFKSIFLAPTPVQQFHGLPNRRCLWLCLKQLRFSAHPQVLEEHRQAQHLEDLYDLYMQHVNNQICRKLSQELQMARHIVARLLNANEQQQSSEQLAAHIQRQLRLVHQLRTRFYAESTAQRTLLQRLLTQWAQLKELRRRQRFQCTRFQLSLRLVQPPDLDAAYTAWKQRFETDLAEVYREHLEAYYRRRRLWQSGEHSSTQRLKPPRKPQFAEIMETLKVQFERAFQDPEEPLVHVQQVVVDESAINVQSNKEEQSQKSRNYYLKIYLDTQFVAQTRSYRLEPDLHVHMNETIGVLLDRSMPQLLNIWLYEKSPVTSHSRRLALISTSLAGEQRRQKLSFQVESSSGGVRPRLAGDLHVQLDYRSTDGAGGSELDDIQILPEALRQTLLPSKLPAWPKNAENTPATPRPPSQRRKPAEQQQHSPLVFSEQQLQLCSVEALLANRRFQLLHSRHQQRNLHTKQLRFVPALEHEIPVVEEQPLDSSGQLLDPGTNWNPIDLHKHRGRKYLQLLYETITSQCAQRAKSLQRARPLLQLFGNSFVLEHTTSWTALWRALCAFFTRQVTTTTPRIREPAWPTQLPPSQPETLSGARQFNVSLHVVRATGVPARSRHILNVERQERRRSSDLSASLFVTQTLMYSNVRPFVTLSYGQRLCRSSTAEGSNPTWNEQLQLQLTGGPHELAEDIKISLFDELIEQQYTDEAADVYQRVQCNWLGEYRIPISRLLSNRKFEGCIELCMPKVLVGYKRPLIDSVTNISIEQYPEFKESVHLWFYLSIEPGCELTPIQAGGLACAELPELQQFLVERRLELQQLLPQPQQRYVDPLVCTSQGKRVCLTRLLEPVPLPPALTAPSSDQLVEILCRFVSLLCPLRSQLDACHSFQGVWLDNQTLLDSTWCSIKDLGVLLCNYLLTLGLECWMLLGFACPYGECTFVIYRQPDSAELLLLAPSTGKRYQLQDVFCPLTRVHCMVGRDNIYFNIQSESRVSMTNFNILDGACWLPLFNKRQPAPQGGVHRLDYAYKRSYDLRQLQKQIERKIMKKIAAWRSTRKTIWNRAFQTRLQRILKDMENLATYSGSRYDEPAYSEELEREYPNFRLYGFTINFPYTNLTAISERIRTTCIHYNNNALVEFCVAVHVKAYANDVLSVWVFLLSIVPLVA
ncbi:LOW QUALITY PROTEIN: coiled-coil and C2 domain-containing protein 2A [Drosophila nasuta]|uniref:LOW QUALITY PROTEIN: coiled-coil and C2 domain-containing protein 2A n=1 Tax=Drosophila nasuta TaxID=42062 RepID=UPI00295F34A1|nr:LOW QUALITY PROTEIN: coiled-coil and C2 domain-containing protein 2A [Drosophila nasuta]